KRRPFQWSGSMSSRRALRRSVSIGTFSPHTAEKPRALASAQALLPLLLLSGCVVRDVREQQAAMQRACSVRGSVEIARPDATAAVVVLLRSGEPLGAAR